MTAVHPSLPAPRSAAAAVSRKQHPANDSAGSTTASAKSTARRGERGSTSALELMALTPMCALLVAFISWAGNTGAAQLAVTLAAQEAATAAAACCNTAQAAIAEPAGIPIDQHTDGPTGKPAAAYDLDTVRQLAAETVIATRPSLERLCAGGPRPGAPHGRWTTHTTAPDTPDGDTTVHVTTAHVTCTADGAAAPLRGLFGTSTVHGHGTHIKAAAAADTSPPQPPQLTEPETGDTP